MSSLRSVWCNILVSGLRLYQVIFLEALSHSRYHYTCAKELGLLQPVLEHEPFVTQNELFLCPEHRSFENDFFLKAMVRVVLNRIMYSQLFLYSLILNGYVSQNLHILSSLS